MRLKLEIVGSRSDNSDNVKFLEVWSDGPKVLEVLN